MKTIYLSVCLALLILIEFPQPAFPTTWYLTPSGPLTIQGAINSSANGDTILLGPGTYTGGGNRSVRFYRKAIVLTSADGPQSTIIDCEYLSTGFFFRDGEGRGTVLSGITVTHGETRSDQYGGAVTILNASPTITGCVFTRNSGVCEETPIPPPYNLYATGAGAIRIQGGSPLIENNVFRINLGYYMGGAILLVNSTAVLRDNAYLDNNLHDFICNGRGGGAIGAVGGGAVIENSFFLRNARDVNYAIRLEGGNHEIRNCTFIKNGDSAVMVLSNNAVALIENCLFAYNPYYGTLFRCGVGSTIALYCNDFWGNSTASFCATDSSGNTFLDPLFVDPDNDNYELLPDSPCLPENNACGVRMGAVPPDFRFSAGDHEKTVIPGGTVCLYLYSEPRAEGVRVNFTVTGANNRTGAAVSDENGEVEWCYTPTSLGVDTLTASARLLGHLGMTYQTSDQIRLILLPPGFGYDRSQHSGADSVLAVPGGTLCARFLTDPAVATAVEMAVRGANNVDDTGATGAYGKVTLCYEAASLGVDTVTATAVFDYGEGVYEASDRLVLISYPPVFEPDPAYHTGADTVVTTPEGLVCAHYRIVPPLAGVSVHATVTGANSWDLTGTTDAKGLVELCYPALCAGLDSVTADAVITVNGKPYHPSAVEEIQVVGGGRVPPVAAMSAEFHPTDNSALVVFLSCNKKLVAPVANFFFERESGNTESSRLPFAAAPSNYVYYAPYDLPNPGHLSIDLSASDVYEVPVNVKREYDVAKALPAYALDYRSNDGAVGLYTEKGSIQKVGRILIERENGWDTPVRDDGGAVLLPVSGRFRPFTNSSLVSPLRMTVWHSFAESEASQRAEGDVRKVGVYRQNGAVWTYVGGQGIGKTVSADVELDHVYAAFFNASHHVVPPRATALFQNYPNPFTPSTTVGFELHEAGNVELTIYDVSGRPVRTLLREYRPAGVYEAQWNGFTDTGISAATGVYFYRLKTVSLTATKKMVKIK